jgi:hypothetical protein
MERDNKKARDDSRREYNETVRVSNRIHPSPRLLKSTCPSSPW